MIDQAAIELIRRMGAGEFTSVELTQACLKQIREFDSRVGAFLDVDDEGALQQAADVDRRRRAGEPLGKLAGVPVALKDLLCVAGRPTTCASKMLQQFVPPYSATAVERLRVADAVLIGKTNLDEFAMGGSNENSALATTRNPWDLTRVPGGSSGGSAACIAARMVPLAVGTDTGGSIRQPASFCGIVGLKPTYGRVSRYGLIAFASSLDQIGPMARTVEDAALLLDVIGGHDPRDSTSIPQPMPELSPLTPLPMTGIRLGVPRGYFGEGLDSQVEQSVREALQVYRSLGATLVELELPHNPFAIATYYIIAPSEASSNLARYDGAHYGFRTDEAELFQELKDERREIEKSFGQDRQGMELALQRMDSPLVRMYRKSRSAGFGAEVKRRIMLGTYALSAGYYDKFYSKALRVRRLIRQDFDQAFAQVDCVIGPVAPTAAFRVGEKVDDPLSMYLGDLYTVGANLAGIPGISIPCGFTTEGLPIGLHLQAGALNELRLLQVADAFQQATDWHLRSPKLT